MVSVYTVDRSKRGRQMKNQTSHSKRLDRFEEAYLKEVSND